MYILHIGSHDCNGTDLPIPSTPLSVSLQDIDASTTGRDATGTMHRDRLVGGATAKRKLSVTWKCLTPSQMSKLLQAISEVSFYIAYNDPYTGGWRSGVEAYAGDRSTSEYTMKDPNNTSTVLWESLTVSLIEL